MLDLLTIGDSTIDAYHLLDKDEAEVSCRLKTTDCHLCLSYADKIPVKEFRTFAGGNAANVAIGASRLGLSSAIVTTLGDDESGRLIREILANEEVSSDYIKIDHDNPTNYSTVLSYMGERTILIYHAPRRYRLPKFTKPRWIYLTSMAQGSEAIFPELANRVRRDNIKLVFQPGTFQLRLGLRPAKELLSETELIIVNKEEAELYLDMPQANTQILIDGLLALGPKIAVITDAKRGAVAGTGRAHWLIRTRPEIHRVEATGAGDAFSVGFTAALARGEDIPTALRWGAFNAEGVIQQVGPQAGLLTHEQMDKQLRLAPNFEASTIR